LGHTQHDFLVLIQVSDLAGAYAVTVLVAAVNAVVFELLYRWQGFRGFLALPAQIQQAGLIRRAMPVAVIVLLGGVYLTYGLWKLEQAEFTLGPRVALLQGNIKQALRNEVFASENRAKDAQKQIIHHFNDLCILAGKQKPQPDLIVWPETSFPEK